MNRLRSMLFVSRVQKEPNLFGELLQLIVILICRLGLKECGRHPNFFREVCCQFVGLMHRLFNLIGAYIELITQTAKNLA